MITARDSLYIFTSESNTMKIYGKDQHEMLDDQNPRFDWIASTRVFKDSAIYVADEKAQIFKFHLSS